MVGVRVKAYNKGSFIAEYIYPFLSQAEALYKCRTNNDAYRGNQDVILVAENYDINDPKNEEHFKACLASEVVM